MLHRISLGALLALAAAACGDGGGAAVPTGPTLSGFVLSSPAFEAGAAIPAEHTCEGADVAPPVRWSGVPEQAVTLALTVLDLDAGGFVHWVAWGLDPALEELAAGSVPPGAAQAVNDFGQVGYGGPCPPASHRYAFTLLALAGRPSVADGATAEDALAAFEEAGILARAELTGVFPGP